MNVLAAEREESNNTGFYFCYSFPFSFVSLIYPPLNCRIWTAKSCWTLLKVLCMSSIYWWPIHRHALYTHILVLKLDFIAAFSPLKIRLGGTLQDKVIYESNETRQHCTQFIKNSSEMFGFSQGCLPMSRWDDLNIFFKTARSRYCFPLTQFFIPLL